MTEKLTAILRDLRRRLATLYGEQLVSLMLYGSQARGEAAPGSDVDVLVVLKGTVSPCEEIARTLPDVADLSLEHGVVIACVFVSEEQFHREQSPLLLNVRAQGIAI